MRRIKIVNIVGARPNFVKIAPLMKEIKKVARFESFLVHTGQHYDHKMSGVFFGDLAICKPDVCLGAGSGSQSQQTAKMMIGLESVFRRINPGLVIVVGDVNSTLAAALVSAKMNIPLAHIEAGLRSFDRTMPEEINRVITDILSDYLFTTCPDARYNLEREGIDRSKIFLVGNVMIDSLLSFKQKAEKLNILKTRFNLTAGGYALLTLHRPSNVDDPAALDNMFKAMKIISRDIPILFPAHPRTQRNIKAHKLKDHFSDSGIRIVDPLGYLEFLSVMMHSKLVLTDSGGIQEETSVLGIPCLTLRKNTERPITVTEGTNIVTGTEPNTIIRQAKKIIFGRAKKGGNIRLWDGHASERIVRVLNDKL